MFLFDNCEGSMHMCAYRRRIFTYNYIGSQCTHALPDGQIPSISVRNVGPTLS